MKELPETPIASEVGEIILMESNDKADLFQPQDATTTEEFVTMIIRSIKGNLESTVDGHLSGYMDYALHKGIIEDYDVVNISKPIERRSAARIVHEILLIESGEEDEKEWLAAEKLSDLYSCRTCVMHIAQVYVKGIMLPGDNNIFDVKGSLTTAEAAAIVVRMLYRDQRKPHTEERAFKSKNLHPEEAWELMLKHSRTMLVDVRTKEEYTIGHIEGSICKPLKDISNNPFELCESKNTPIILYCEKGYKSSLAAQALIDAGYSKIYTIPGIGQYQYNLVK
jgi:rhodanese-related sulfurtransferase